MNLPRFFKVCFSGQQTEKTNFGEWSVGWDDVYPGRSPRRGIARAGRDAGLPVPVDGEVTLCFISFLLGSPPAGRV
jgi:hypothetical protein